MPTDRPIRVAQLIGEFGGGGAERQAYNLVVGLERLGARSLAIAVRSPGVYIEEHEGDLEVVSLGARRGSVRSGLGALFRLRRTIREFRPDVIHVQGSHSVPLVVLASRGMRRKPRILFTWQDSESVLLERGFKRRLMVWSLRRCDRVFGSSRSVVERLESGAGLDGLDTFHGGVPATEPPARSWGDEAGILWIGRFVTPKDPQALIRAAAALREEGLGFRVHLVGSGPQGYYDETVGLIRELGVEDTVTAHGYVDEEQLGGILESSQIGVQTSHTEGLSMALLEQMMAGLAIVATDVGDTSVALRDGECGLLVAPRDPEALAGSLRKLLEDPELRKTLGSRARRHAADTYSLEAMCRRALSEYEAVLRGE